MITYPEHLLQVFKTHVRIGCAAPGCDMAFREGQRGPVEAIEPRAPEHRARIRHCVID